MELKRIKKRAQLKLKNKLRDKICAREDEHCTYRAKCKIASCNAQHRPYNNCNAPTTMNAEQQSALVLSAPAIATGRMTVVTISLKS